MRVERALFVEPDRNAAYVAAALALSILVFAYSTRFGPLSILAFYGVWFLPVLIDPRIVTRRVALFPILLLPAALAVLSTAWSEAPSASLRGGIQYATTIVCAVIAARIVGPVGLFAGGITGFGAVLAYSVVYGGFSYDVLDAGYSFVGAFGSKNQLGLFASLGLIFGVIAAFAGSLPLALRAYGVASIPFAALILLASNSVTSIVAAAGAFGAAVSLALLRRVRPPDRLSLLVVLGFVLATVAVVAIETNAFGHALRAFGKDPTLTGRTYLWSEGIRAIRENPLAGMGYQAFWQHGHVPAERLWEAFYITGRAGFHFHNTYIEAAVAFGLVGLGVFLLVPLLLVGLMLRSVVSARLSAETVLVLVVAAVLVVRSFVEIDFLQPYTVGTFFLTFALARLVERHRAELFRAGPAMRRGTRGAAPSRTRPVPAGPSSGA